jgi:AAA15 family ATPase/GTPase
VLVRFRVENHRSIRDVQTLSMVAAEPLDDPRPITSPAVEEKLLPAIPL